MMAAQVIQGSTNVQSRLINNDTCIYTESINGSWAWQWSFDENATFEMLRIPTDGKWWFLYEGTPAGKFDPKNTQVEHVTSP